MADTERLRRQKKRLTRLLTEADNARLDAGKDVRPKRWLRTRIYRIDLLLEREGMFGG